MQIRRKIDADTFGDVPIGDVFKCYDNFYMKISETEYRNGPVITKANAINLENGALSVFKNEDFVSKSKGAFFERIILSKKFENTP